MSGNDNLREVNKRTGMERSPSPTFGIGRGLTRTTDTRSSGRSPAEELAIKTAGRVTESWGSHREEGALKRRRNETDLDKKSEIDLIEDKGKRVRLSAKDTRDAIEQPGHSSSSTTNSDQGWQGTSAQTFEALLRKAVQELNVNQYQDVKKLGKAIYELYVENSEQPKYNKEEEEEKTYRESLDNYVKGASAIEDIGHKQKGGYDHFVNNSVDKYNKAAGRYSLNIHPDIIPNVIPRMIREIATLPYVYNVKVLSDKFWAKKRLDNVIVYFCNSEDNKNRHELEQELRLYGEYTRPSHPAMMEPIEGIEGIAFADQDNANIKGGGWGRTRTEHIADIMWDIKEKGEEITFEKLLPEVKKRFRENNIDPDNPYRDLPSP